MRMRSTEMKKRGKERWKKTEKKAWKTKKRIRKMS